MGRNVFDELILLMLVENDLGGLRGEKPIVFGIIATVRFEK